MKNILLSSLVGIIILINGCSSPSQPQPEVLSGVWDGEILNIEEQPVYLDIDFDEENGTISGYARIHRTSGKIIEGNLDGNWDGSNIEFSLTSIDDSIKVSFSGTGDYQSISGSYTVTGNLLKQGINLFKVKSGGFNITNRGTTTSKIAGIYTYIWTETSDFNGSASGSFRIAMISDSNKIYANAVSGKMPFYKQEDTYTSSPSAVNIGNIDAGGSIIGDQVTLTLSGNSFSSNFTVTGSLTFAIGGAIAPGLDFTGSYYVTGPE